MRLDGHRFCFPAIRVLSSRRLSLSVFKKKHGRIDDGRGGTTMPGKQLLLDDTRRSGIVATGISSLRGPGGCITKHSFGSYGNGNGPGTVENDRTTTLGQRQCPGSNR